MKSTLPLLFLACLAAPAAWAATPINESRPLDARGHVEIENIKGRIQVRVWDKQEVRITGSLGKGVEKLEVEGDRNHLAVRVKYPKRTTWGDRDSEPTELVLNVPVLAVLDIEGVAVDIDVVGTAGESLTIESVSGDVVVAGAPQQAHVESVSGDLQLTLNSREVHAESVSGDVQLGGRLDGEVHGETVSGNIRVDSKGLRLRDVSAASVSGDTELRIGLADGGSIDAESVSGNIRLFLPKSLSARVSGESFSGSLRAPGAHIERPKYGPGSSFEHRYGSGNGEVNLESFSGDVDLQLD